MRFRVPWEVAQTGDGRLNVVQLGVPNLKAVPESLRALADAIDRGDQPEAVHCLVVALDEHGEISIYAYGKVGDRAHEVGTLYMASMQLAVLGAD